MIYTPEKALGVDNSGCDSNELKLTILTDNETDNCTKQCNKRKTINLHVSTAGLIFFPFKTPFSIGSLTPESGGIETLQSKSHDHANCKCMFGNVRPLLREKLLRVHGRG